MPIHRLHVVGLPHTNTTAAFSSCAYTQKVRKFCDMMTAQGNEVFLYAGEQNEAACDEHVPCITEAQRAEAVGDQPYVNASWDTAKPHWGIFNANVVKEIRKRGRFSDVLCVIGGTSHQPIAAQLNAMRCVEFGIGYAGTFSPFRVWESYAWMHACYGAQAKNPMDANGYWYDAVIPGYVDTSIFAPRGDYSKEDYFLYVGRRVDRKGINVAIEVCRHAGKRLLVVGGGEEGAKQPNVEYLGDVDSQACAAVMAGAQALLAPTLYVEPFGNAAVEAMCCGTAVISTDWGAFTETVVDGLTGFRCRNRKEFCDAMDKVGRLDYARIADYAGARYSLPVIANKYQAYFDRLGTLDDAGWYQQ